jgi:hypothetical protein
VFSDVEMTDGDLIDDGGFSREAMNISMHAVH